MASFAGSNGSVLYFTASQGYTKGDFYVKGASSSGYGGVCLDDAKSGERVAVQTRGVIEGVRKSQAAQSITAGQRLYTSDSALSVDNRASGRLPVGYAMADSGAGVTTVDVFLTVGI